MSYMCRKFAGRECSDCGACRKSREVGRCTYCNEPIYDSEEYYDIYDVLLHEDCLFYWANEYKVS